MNYFISYFSSPLGILQLIVDDYHLLQLDYVSEEYESHHNHISKQTHQELNEYFNQQRTTFTIPLKPIGTLFQMKVWSGLQQILYAETCSYKEVAEMINHPKAYRAVGNANNKNPISIIIPCHRVIGADKQLVGYGGGLDKKIWLLEHEQNSLHHQTIK